MSGPIRRPVTADTLLGEIPMHAAYEMGGWEWCDEAALEVERFVRDGFLRWVPGENRLVLGMRMVARDGAALPLPGEVRS